jgi:periplasmic protein CpxP/Spy
MKRQVLAVMSVVALGTAAIAAAQAPAGAPRQRQARAGMSFEMMKQQLGLTEAQASQLEKVRTDERRAAIQRRADVQLAKLELEQLMKADTVDEKAIAARVKQLTDLHGAALKARVDGRLALKKILTPEQQAKLRQLHAERPRGPRGDRPAGFRGRPAPAPGVDGNEADGEDGGQPFAGPF